MAHNTLITYSICPCLRFCAQLSPALDRLVLHTGSSLHRTRGGSRCVTEKTCDTERAPYPSEMVVEPSCDSRNAMMRWRKTCRCWANSQRSHRSTVDVLVPQAVEQVLEVPKIPSRDRILQCTVEQIFDVPVLEKAEQLAEVPKIVPQDRIQQRTVELFRRMWRNRQSSSRLPLRTGFNSVSEDRSLNPLLIHSLRRSLRYPSFRRKKRNWV